VVTDIETTAIVVGGRGCDVPAEVQDSMQVEIRDLPCFGRPARLVSHKRRRHCPRSRCARRGLGRGGRARVCPGGHDQRGVEMCRQVGENARPVSQLADKLGVRWWTIMTAVDEHGRPAIDGPNRIGPVRTLRVDETSFLWANRDHPPCTRPAWSTSTTAS
jgi:transposase